MQIYVYRDLSALASNSILGTEVANQSVNNDWRTEEKVLVRIFIIPDIHWLHWKPRNIGCCKQRQQIFTNVVLSQNDLTTKVAVRETEKGNGN